MFCECSNRRQALQSLDSEKHDIQQDVKELITLIWKKANPRNLLSRKKTSL